MSGHFFQLGNAIGQRRMGIKEPGKPANGVMAVFERVNDIEMSGGFVGCFQRFTIGTKFFESGDKTTGLTGKFDGRSIG